MLGSRHKSGKPPRTIAWSSSSTCFGYGRCWEISSNDRVSSSSIAHRPAKLSDTAFIKVNFCKPVRMNLLIGQKRQSAGAGQLPAALASTPRGGKAADGFTARPRNVREGEARVWLRQDDPLNAALSLRRPLCSSEPASCDAHVRALSGALPRSGAGRAQRARGRQLIRVDFRSRFPLRP